MTRHSLTRGAFAVAMGIALSVGGLAPLATAADTPTAQEAVVPATFKSTPRGGTPYLAERSRYLQADGAGAQGVFHTEDGLQGVQWTRYADGKTVPVTEPGTPWTVVQATGADTLAYLRAGEVELRHADGTAQTVDLGGLEYPRVYGSTVVAFKMEMVEGSTNRKATETHLLSPTSDGGTRDVLVGRTAEGGLLGASYAADDTHALLRLNDSATGETYRLALVSKETGKPEALTPPIPKGYGNASLSSAHVTVSSTSGTGSVLVYSRADLSAAPATLTTPGSSQGTETVVGDWLVYRDYDRVSARPIAGGEPVVLVSRSSRALSHGPDGTAVAIGGTGADDWGIRRITADAAGKPTVTLVKKFAPVPAHVQGIALTQGRLAVVDDSVSVTGRAEAYVRAPGISGTPADGKRQTLFSYLAACKADDIACARLLGLGDGSFARFEASEPSSGFDFYRITGHGSMSAPKGGRLTDASAGQVLHTIPGASGKNRVLDAPSSSYMEYGPGAVSLEGDRNWYPSTTDKGTLLARKVTDLDYEGARAGMPIPCTPQELQMVGRWTYWNCGPDGPAGVVDQNTWKSSQVPTGDALLGDGYVVTHDKAAGKLVLTGTDAAQPVSRVIGDLPDTGVDQRHIRWSVDRFGGGIAYVDAQEQVHVVPSGIAAQRLTVAEQRNDAGVVDAATAAVPLTRVTFSKPVASWTLSVRHTTTGQQTEVARGGETRGALKPLWNGRDAAGNPLLNGPYQWTLTAQPADGVGPAVEVRGTTTLRNALSTASEAYTAVTPQRLMDTRYGTGAPKAKIGPNGTVTLTVAGKAGIPAGVTAVALNLTVTNATANTYVTGYPYGTPRPGTSHVNVPAGRTVPNAVVVPVKDGKVTFANHAGTVDLIADVQGYYTPGAGLLYNPLAPARLLDTRSGLGAPKSKLQGHQTLAFTVADRGGVPAGAKAVVLNVTATRPTTSTVVSVVEQNYTIDWWGPSLLNPMAGQTVSNVVIAPVRNGEVYLYNHAGAVDLLADVQGYYMDGAGSRYEPLAPARVMDTRTGTGVAKAKVGPGGTVTLNVAGRAGVSALDVTAVVLNVTATNATAGTYVTAYPYGTARSAASNLNVVAGQTVANLVVVPVKDGKVTFYNHGGTIDLIADVQGYFAR